MSAQIQNSEKGQELQNISTTSLMKPINTPMEWLYPHQTENCWIIKHVPQTSQRGEDYLRVFDHPLPIAEDEWQDVMYRCNSLTSKWAITLDDNTDLADLSQKILQLFDKKRKKIVDKSNCKLLARFSATHIRDVKGSKDVGKEVWLDYSSEALFWVCVSDILGFLEEEKQLYCYEGEINGITEEGNKIRSDCITGMNEGRFLLQDIFKEGIEGAHDSCQWANLQLGSIQDIGGFETAIKGLWNTLNRSYEENSFLATTIKLAKTPPAEIPGWTGSSLHLNLIAAIWVAANNFFGSVWEAPSGDLTPLDLSDDLAFPENASVTDVGGDTIMTEIETINLDPLGGDKMDKQNKNPTPVTPSSILNNKNKTNSAPRAKRTKIGTEETKNSSKNKLPKNPYNNDNYRKEENLKVRAGRKKKKGPDKKTFLRVRLPTQIDSVEQWNEMTNLTIKLLNSVWKSLLLLDSSNSSIEVWNDKGTASVKPLRLDSVFPTAKSKIHQKLVEDLKVNWTSSNTPTELRFILGHKKDIEFYMDNKEVNKKLEEMETELVEDRIQVEKRAVAGYLAGPLIRERSADIIADILIKKPVFIANKITQMEIYVETINIQQGTSRKIVKRTKAMHIKVPNDMKALARSCLASAYPSKVRGDYPMGIQFRFIPNTADPDFAISPTARQIARRLKAKQACFLDRCITREHWHFKDLFVIHKIMESVSLLKVLMALKSKRFPERQLFICIEQDIEDGPVFFQYAEELEDEADGIIPVIPLYLEGNFGTEVKKWLKPSSSIGTEGYTYDKNKNKVVPNKVNPLKEMNDEWEQRIERDDDSSISDVESDDDTGGFAIEFGNIDYKNSNRKSNLGDDTGSLGTMGLENPSDFKKVSLSKNNHAKKKELVYSKRMPEHLESNNNSQQEDIDLFLRMKNNTNLMKLVDLHIQNELTAPSKQDGGGKES